MDKVFRGPLLIVLVSLPLLVHIEQGQVVGFRYLEVLSGLIRLLFTVFGPEENSWNRQHTHYSEDFFRALEILTDDQHF